MKILRSVLTRLEAWSGVDLRRYVRIARALPVLALGVFLLGVVAVVRLVRDVRIAWIMPERIGHFSFDVAYRFAAQQETPPGSTTIHCLLPEGPISNSFWMTMFKRNLTVRSWPRPIARVGQHLRNPPAWLIPPARVTHGSRDPGGLLQRVPARMEFTAREDETAKEWLSSLGWRQDEPFVCLLVRDSAYLDAAPGLRSEDWRYHDYRDSNIGDYLPAAEWLADQGVWVIRMGKTMAEPMDSSHPRIIDYAFRTDRSDFLDIWLFANCSLCISTGTGPDMIPIIYQRPALWVNYLPALSLVSWENVVTAPKPLVWRDSGRRLSFTELIAAHHSQSKEYEAQGIEVRNLDPDAVRAIVEEAWLRSQGRWSDHPSDARRQTDAWQKLEAHPAFPGLHGYRHPSARFSSVWLRKLEQEFVAGDRR